MTAMNAPFQKCRIALIVAAIVVAGGALTQSPRAESIDYSTLFHWSSSVSFDQVPRAVDEDGGIAFILLPQGLEAMDVAGPGAPTHVGTLNLPGSPADLVVRDGFAYVVSGGAGLLVIDVSDPGSPAIVGTLGDPTEAVQIALSGNRAYIRESLDRLRVVDVSVPTAPALLATFAPAYAIDNMAVDDDLVCLTSFSDMILVDFADPSVPHQLSSTYVECEVHGVAMAAGRVYVGYRTCSTEPTSGMFNFDVTDPSHPVRAGGISEIDSPVRIVLQGNVAYTVGEYGQMTILDVSDPGDVTVLRTQLIGGEDLAMIEGGGACFIRAYYSGGGLLEVYRGVNLEDHALGEVLLQGDGFSGMDVLGNRIYLTDPSGSIRVVDASDPRNPITTGWIPLADAFADLEVTPSAMFACGFQRLHYGRLLNPNFVHWCAQDPQYAVTDHIALEGNTLFVAPRSGNVYLVDVTDPCSPTTLGMLPTTGEVREIAAQGSYLYVAVDATFVVADVSDPSSPIQIASLDGQDVPYAEAMAVSGNLALLTLWGGELWFVDITNPENPVTLETMPFAQRPNSAGGVQIEGDIAYVSCDAGGGIYIINVSDPSHPYVIGGSYIGFREGQHAAGATRVALASNCIVLSDRAQGLILMPRHRFTAGAEDGVAAETRILSAMTNPSTGPSVLRLDLPTTMSVRLSVHDVQGREARVLHDGTMPAGVSDLSWDGRNEGGVRVPSGIYFARLRCGGQAESVRLVRID